MQAQTHTQPNAKTVHTRNRDPLTQYLDSGNCDAAVRQYLDASLAGNTRRAYRADLQHFIAWGGVIPATAASVATYIARHA